MTKIFPVRAVLLIVGLLFCAVVNAGHDDSSLIALRATVSNVNAGDVTIDVIARGYSGSQLNSARLGTQFFFDKGTATNTPDQWITPVPPAIDWGDGSTVPSAVVPRTSFDSSTATNNRSISFYSGQFMHTYAAPGNYTIRLFGTNVYAYCCTSYGITSGWP